MKVRILVASLVVVFATTACTTHGQESSRNEIDAKVRSALVTFGETVKGGDALIQKADGVLVFLMLSKAELVLAASTAKVHFSLMAGQ